MADETIPNDRTTKDRATDVATTAQDEARSVANDARGEAVAVVSEAGTQARALADEARTALRQQASDGTSRAAGAVDQLAIRLRALAEGDTDHAGDLRRYARDLGDRLGDVAGRMQERGLDGLVDDVQTFARRRPTLFLAAAAGAGFAAGRLFRGAKADAEATNGAGNGHASGTGTTGLGVSDSDSSQGAAEDPATGLPSAAGSAAKTDEQERAAQLTGLEVQREPRDTGAEPAGPEGGTTPAPDPYGAATAQTRGRSE